jgi:hypothetical protein
VDHAITARPSNPDLTEPRVAIIVGSTRPSRKAGTVSRWVLHIAARREDATSEVVDIADHALPHLDEGSTDAARVPVELHGQPLGDRGEADSGHGGVGVVADLAALLAVLYRLCDVLARGCEIALGQGG